MRCDSAGNRTRVRNRDDARESRVHQHPVRQCEARALARSSRRRSTTRARRSCLQPRVDALVSQALSMGAQAGFAPAPATLDYAPLRYNRIEGLELGRRARSAARRRVLAAHRGAHRRGRSGAEHRAHRARVPICVARSGSPSTTGSCRRATGAIRLSTGSSISALLFGRDEGFYYRATGAELSSAPNQGGSLNHSWSLFVEQERNAEQRTTFSFARAMRRVGVRAEHHDAARAVGGRAHAHHAVDRRGPAGLPPVQRSASRGGARRHGHVRPCRARRDRVARHRQWRRGAHRRRRHLVRRDPAAARLVPRRLADRARTASGHRDRATPSGWRAPRWLRDWAPCVPSCSPTWAGPATAQSWSNIGVPMSGAGAGFSILDGLLRFDVARGIKPTSAVEGGYVRGGAVLSELPLPVAGSEYAVAGVAYDPQK